MMRLLSALFAFGCLAIAIPAQAATPFEGRWGGGPATCRKPFTITGKTYRPPGGKTLTIKSIERDGQNYLLTFLDGYRVALFDVTRDRLTWHSPISGDTFDLIRCN